MPLYEYTCEACGHRFEALRRVGEGTEGLSCPRCGGGEVTKQFSTFAGSVSGGTAAGCGPGGFT